MKSFLKYPLIFLISFMLAGGAVFYAIKLFTKSAQEIVVPKLTGKNIIYVLETLSRLGLNAQLYGSQYDESIPKYAVLSQDPVPGTTIKKGRDVVIYISKGKKHTVVPDLRRLDFAKAVIAIEKHEFQKGHISYTYSNNTHKGQIISQYPGPFNTAVKGTACHLLVSRGPEPRKFFMPNLNALPLNKAVRAIEKLKLKLGQIRTGQDSQKEHGSILSQTPPFGSPVTPEDPISLVINHPGKGLVLNPDRLEELKMFVYQVEPGFIKSHIRVETDYFGPIIDLYNDYAVPSEAVVIFVPMEKKSDLRLYIDGSLVSSITVDPWKQDTITGELAWELLPLQFYPLTSQNWVMN